MISTLLILVTNIDLPYTFSLHNICNFVALLYSYNLCGYLHWTLSNYLLFLWIDDIYNQGISS